MVLLVLSPAWADDCPAHPSPERFHTRLEALVEPVAFADPAARGELDEILILLEKGCVQGPVPRDDIATVHLLRGSYAILADRNLTEGETTLRWAAQWGPPPATSFGPEVESRIEGMTDWGSGELDITFAWEPNQVVLDGEPLLDQGVQQVVDGYHVVQWKLDDGWFGIGVVVEEGARVHVGTGDPTIDPIIVDPTQDPSQEESHNEGHILVLGGYSVLSAQVSDGAATYGGLLGLPTVAVQGSWGQRARLVGSLRGGPPPGPGRVPVGTELRVGVGFGGERSSVAVTGLLGLLPVATAPESGSMEEPWFTASLAPGGMAHGTLAFGSAHGRIGLGLQGQARLGEIELLWVLPGDEVELLLAPRGHALFVGEDRYLGLGLQAGIRFGL